MNRNLRKDAKYSFEINFSNYRIFKDYGECRKKIKVMVFK